MIDALLVKALDDEKARAALDYRLEFVNLLEHLVLLSHEVRVASCTITRGGLTFGHHVGEGA